MLVCGAIVNGPYALITTAVSADLGAHKSLKNDSKLLASVTGIIDGTGSIGAALQGVLISIISSRYSWDAVFYALIAWYVLSTRWHVTLWCGLGCVVAQGQHGATTCDVTLFILFLSCVWCGCGSLCQHSSASSALLLSWLVWKEVRAKWKGSEEDPGYEEIERLTSPGPGAFFGGGNRKQRLAARRVERQRLAEEQPYM